MIVFTCSFTSDQTESVGEDIQRADERIEKEKQAENLGQSHQHSQHFTSSVQFCCSFFKKLFVSLKKHRKASQTEENYSYGVHSPLLANGHYYLQHFTQLSQTNQSIIVKFYKTIIPPLLLLCTYHFRITLHISLIIQQDLYIWITSS